MNDRTRRDSNPVNSAAFTERIKPFRSLRDDKRKIRKKPDVSVILETEPETGGGGEGEEGVEMRSKKTKISSRPTSSGSTYKEKPDKVYDRTISLNRSSKEFTAKAYVNAAYIGSNQNLNQSSSTIESSRIVREQYWKCKKCTCWPWRWSRREKILLWVVISLLGIICALFVIVAILADKREFNNSTVTEKVWYPFRL